MFEKFLEQGLANLNEKLSSIAEALQEQNVTSAKKMDHLMESQGQRRELCGQRGAEIVALQKSDVSQWEEHRLTREKLSEQSKIIWRREGMLVVVAGLFSAAVSIAARYLFH